MVFRWLLGALRHEYIRFQIDKSAAIQVRRERSNYRDHIHASLVVLRFLHIKQGAFVLRMRRPILVAGVNVGWEAIDHQWTLKVPNKDTEHG